MWEVSGLGEIEQARYLAQKHTKMDIWTFLPSSVPLFIACFLSLCIFLHAAMHMSVVNTRSQGREFKSLKLGLQVVVSQETSVLCRKSAPLTAGTTSRAHVEGSNFHNSLTVWNLVLRQIGRVENDQSDRDFENSCRLHSPGTAFENPRAWILTPVDYESYLSPGLETWRGGRGRKSILCTMLGES